MKYLIVMVLFVSLTCSVNNTMKATESDWSGNSGGSGGGNSGGGNGGGNSGGSGK